MEVVRDRRGRRLAAVALGPALPLAGCGPDDGTRVRDASGDGSEENHYANGMRARFEVRG